MKADARDGFGGVKMAELLMSREMPLGNRSNSLCDRREGSLA